MYFFSYSILLMCSYLCTHFICIMIQWSKHKILLLYKHNILFIYIDFHILKENSYSCSKNDEVWYLHMRAKRLFNIFWCSPTSSLLSVSQNTQEFQIWTWMRLSGGKFSNLNLLHTLGFGYLEMLLMEFGSCCQ